MKRIASLFAAGVVLVVANVSWGQNFWEPANGAPVGAVIAMAVADNGEIVVSTNIEFDSIYLSSDNGMNWSSTGGPGGVGVILNSPNSFLFAEYICCGGVHCSTDHGEHWITIAAPNDGHSMAIDSSGRIICSGIRETRDTLYQPHQQTEIQYFDTAVIEISSDEGQTWSETPLLYQSVHLPEDTPNNAPFISSIAVGRSGNIIVAGSTGDIFQSNDGKIWERPVHALGSAISAFVISPQGKIFAGTTSGLFRLDDTTWTKVGNLDSAIYSITIDHRGILYVLTHQGFFRSADGGISWTSIQNGLGVLIDNGNFGAISSPVYCVSVSLDDRIFVGTPSELYLSTDEGTNWKAISQGLSFVTSNWGFGIQNPIISTAGQLIVWTSGGLYRSTDDGERWHVLPISQNRFGSINDVGPYLVIRTDSGFFRSSDSGLTWEPINEGLTLKDSSGTYLWFYSILSDPYGDLFLQSNLAWYVSTNFGTTWQQPEFENTEFTVFTSNSNGTIWGGGDGGIFQSTDRGATWHRMNNGLFDTTVFSLTIDRNGNLFAATQSSKIFRSRDSGNSWQYLITVDTLSADPRVNSALVVDSNNRLYCGMDGGSGILRSTDNGQTWDQVNSGSSGDGLINQFVEGMAVTSTGRIFAGTESGGLWRSINTTLDAVHNLSERTSSICLAQDSPNPFPQSTAISFTLPSPGYSTLTLFDATGREVRRIASGYFSAGEHSVEFARGTLPASVYFYRLEADGQSVTRAMVMQ